MSSLAPSPLSGATKGPGAASSTGAAFALLLACCAVEARKQADRDSFHELLHDPDWDQLLSLAEHHGITPLVYEALREHADAVPSAILERLRRRYEDNARRNLRFTAELFRILDCLEAHAIDAIPYKGPVLAETVYGELGRREFSDLDVIVHPADVVRAREALKLLEYRPSLQLTHSEERAYVRSGYEYSFDGPAGANLLEIQWGIVPKFFAVDFSVEEFFESAVHVDLAGRKVKTLSSEDLLLALSVHGAKHAWIRLCWLRDISTVSQQPSLDWKFIGHQARELGIERILSLSLLLASRMLRGGIPEAWQTKLQGDARVSELCNRIEKIISESSQYSTRSFDYFRLMLRLRERARDRVRFALRLTLTPSIGEWSVVPLPAPLFPLYRVIRIGRLGARAFRSRAGG
jgi:hypothetical protein